MTSGHSGFPGILFFLLIDLLIHYLCILTDEMFTAIRNSINPSRSSHALQTIRTSAQSFFVPDRTVHFDPDDIPLTAAHVHLSRNKTERHRLQGLVKTVGKTEEVGKVRTFGEKVKVWMINDGTSCNRRGGLMSRYESVLSCILAGTPCGWIWDVDDSLQDER